MTANECRHRENTARLVFVKGLFSFLKPFLTSWIVRQHPYSSPHRSAMTREPRVYPTQRVKDRWKVRCEGCVSICIDERKLHNPRHKVKQ